MEIAQCPNTKDIYILGRNPEQKNALFFRPACGMWSCPVCGEANAEEIVHRASRGAIILDSEGHELQFVTLTSRHYATPNKSLYFFKQNWPKLRKRIAYHTKKELTGTGLGFLYFLVPERHKSGVLHAHLVAATPIRERKDWKKHAYKSGFGYMLDIKEVISPMDVARYVSKYLAKQVGDDGWPKGFMHYRHSQAWPKSKPKEIEGWSWERYRSRDEALIDLMDLQINGWHLVDRTKDE